MSTYKVGQLADFFAKKMKKCAKEEETEGGRKFRELFESYSRKQDSVQTKKSVGEVKGNKRSGKHSETAVKDKSPNKKHKNMKKEGKTLSNMTSNEENESFKVHAVANKMQAPTQNNDVVVVKSKIKKLKRKNVNTFDDVMFLCEKTGSPIETDAVDESKKRKINEGSQTTVNIKNGIKSQHAFTDNVKQRSELPGKRKRKKQRFFKIKSCERNDSVKAEGKTLDSENVKKQQETSDTVNKDKSVLGSISKLTSGKANVVNMVKKNRKQKNRGNMTGLNQIVGQRDESHQYQDKIVISAANVKGNVAQDGRNMNDMSFKKKNWNKYRNVTADAKTSVAKFANKGMSINKVQATSLKLPQMNVSLGGSCRKKKKKEKVKNEGQNSGVEDEESYMAELKKKVQKHKISIPGLNAEPELKRVIPKSENESFQSLNDDDDAMSDSDDSSDSNLSENERLKTILHSKRKKAKVIDSHEKLKRTVFVGNMPKNMDKKDLINVFKPYGTVQSCRFRSLIPSKPSVPKKVANIKREYHEGVTSLQGYVVFKHSEEAQNSLKLNGTVLNGHHIQVDRAWGKGKVQNKKSIFVGNLPFNVEDETLWAYFSTCGDVVKVRVVRDKETGLGRGFGFVQFQERSSVEAALKLNDSVIEGRKVRVKPAINVKGENSGTSNEGTPFKSKLQSPEEKREKWEKFNFKKKYDGVSNKTKRKLLRRQKLDKQKNRIALMFKDV